MRTRPMIDPRMLDRISGFFLSSVDVQISIQTIDTMGTPIDEWSTILEGVPASVAPFHTLLPVSGERLEPSYSYDITTRRIILKGFYPQITDKMFLLFDDGRRFNILGVEFDSHSITTRIVANEVVT